MIVNGQKALLGSSHGEVDAAIDQFLNRAAEPAIRVSANAVVIGAGKPSKPATLWLAPYDPRSIEGGENSDRLIVHRNIVRELTALGLWRGTEAQFKVSRGAKGLQTAEILQSRRGGPFIAARRF